MDISAGIPAVTVFLQGLLSFFSPCVLPLLPVYIGYLSGGTAAAGEDGTLHYDRIKVLVNTIFFVIGIGFSFFLLGFGLRTIGRFFGGNQLLFARIGGIIVILFGLYQLGIFGSSTILEQERRLPLRLDKAAMSPVTALILGFVFSFAWTPCVGPVLSGVLLMAASARNSAAGFALIGVYMAGFALPFLLTGIFTTSLLSLFRKHRNILRYTLKISGALLVVMGILMVTGWMNSITGYLSEISQAPGGSAEQTAASVSVKAQEEPEAAAPAEEPETSVPAEEQEKPEASTPAEEQDEPEESKASISAEEQEEPQATQGTDPAEESEAAEADTEPAAEETEVFPAPDFTLTDQFGNVQTLSDYKGKIVFLNFWATWCPPCRAEMPYIQSIYEETLADPDSDLVILGVSFPGIGKETDEQGIRDFMEENGYTYPTVMAGMDLMGQYFISAYPTTFMIDKEGNIYGYVPGSMSKEIMLDIIAQTRAGE